MNNWLAPNCKSYFWRNYNQSEVDYIEINQNELLAYEIKWNIHKKHSVTKAFTNAYPNAKTDIVTPLSFSNFCRID